MTPALLVSVAALTLKEFRPTPVPVVGEIGGPGFFLLKRGASAAATGGGLRRVGIPRLVVLPTIALWAAWARAAMTSQSERKAPAAPHWLFLLLIPLVIGLLLTWFGVNDWRVPWAKPSTTSTLSESTQLASSPNGTNVAPVKLRVLSDGGVDVTWSALSDTELNYYEVDVSAVSPITYTYGVPYYPGTVDTSSRIYPVTYLNKLLADEHRTERVASGQIWHVCVTGMRKTPNNVDITPYIIKGSKACSDDFTLP